MEAGCLLGLLSILAIEDKRKKKVPVVPIVACGMLGVVFHLIYGRIDAIDMLGGFFVGVLLFFLSLYTKGKVGMGDGILVMTTGVYMGFWNNLMLLWLASLMAGIFGVGYCIKKHQWRGVRLPFVPFLLVAFCVMLVLQEGRLS